MDKAFEASNQLEKIGKTELKKKSPKFNFLLLFF